jgi:hypothetical protein
MAFSKNVVRRNAVDAHSKPIYEITETQLETYRHLGGACGVSVEMVKKSGQPFSIGKLHDTVRGGRMRVTLSGTPEALSRFWKAYHASLAQKVITIPTGKERR